MHNTIYSQVVLIIILNLLILNNSFQNIQNDLKDMLAKVIKNVSIDKKINVVLLKENVFLYNKASLDLTNEVLKIFNERTKSLKINY